MAFARSSLKTFLLNAKSTLSTGLSNGQKLTLVIGNESADLDSLTSSLLLAYIRSNAPPANAFSRLYLPVVNLPAADLHLRPEFQELLTQVNVQTESLITLDDLPKPTELKSRLPPESTRWILVDHNALQGYLGAEYSSRVQGVIDHHDDEHKVPADTGDEPRIIEKTGSCTSLVTNYCREAWDKMSSDALSSGAALAQDDASSAPNDAAYTKLWDAQLAKVALASILIDTTNMQIKSKVTDHDVEAVSYLEAKILSSGQSGVNFNRDHFFDGISEAKHNIGNLKLKDILRKDYKQWKEGNQTLGVSSVVKSIDFLADNAVKEQSSKDKPTAFLDTVSAFQQDRGLDLFGIMTTSTSDSGEFRRELYLSAANADAVQAATRFEKESKAELNLAAWRGSLDDIDDKQNDQSRNVWEQLAVQHSRKQVAPLLRKAMNG